MSGNINFNGWLNDDGSENYKCRAWVNFNGSGTVAIRASGNVSSITDTATGQFTVNFTTAMPDTNYATGCLAGDINNGTAQDNSIVTTKNQNTTSISLITRNIQSSGSVLDSQMVSLAIFR